MHNYSRKDVIDAVRSDCENTLNGRKSKQNGNEHMPDESFGLSRRIVIQMAVCVIALLAGLYISRNDNMKKICIQAEKYITDSTSIHNAEEYICNLAERIVHKN